MKGDKNMLKAPWYRPEDDFIFTMYVMEEENKKNDEKTKEEEDYDDFSN